ncbi:MAG: bifunctional chorismate mutase/prephenate dehydrogenase [Ignisphaera sp.]
MLREEIDRIDDEIAELIGKRIELVKRIAELKRRRGVAITDIEREAEVILKWRKRLAKHGVPTDVATSIARDIIASSKVVEIKAMVVNPPKDRGICIVGYGAMAKTLVLSFKNEGYRITITGRDVEKATAVGRELGVDAKPIHSALDCCSISILALSMDAFTSGFIDSIAGYMKGKIVMDILSSKQRVFKHLESLSKDIGFRYISTHPLFGPYSSPTGEKVVLIPSETGYSAIDEAMSLWLSIGVEPVVATLDEHEKAMAVVQTLTHFLLMAYSKAVEKLSKEMGVDVTRFATPTFRDVYAVVARLKKICNTVEEIQRENPYAHEIRSRFLDISRELSFNAGRGLCSSS